MNRSRPLIFGEVLFDRFPDGSEVLGGAPFNTAWHLQGFGASPVFVSRIGDDAAGRRVKQAMLDWGMDTSALQTDPIHDTGAVEISLVDGEPHYRIQPDQAYGHIEASGLDGLRPPALIYHGSLALWRRESRHALDVLARRFEAPIFLDVNLRAPWWAMRDVSAWMERASWVKLNLDELGQLESGADEPVERASAMCERLNLLGVVVTLGSDGAFLVDRSGRPVSVAPAGTVDVVDTVGAGDAFASVLMLGLLERWGPAVALARAQEFAAAIVGVRGATVASRGFYQSFVDRWRSE
jgi:fructokinase